MRELATLTQNGTYTINDAANAELEFDALVSEIDRIQSKTKFNGSLDVSLSTAALTYSFQVGFNGGDAVSISLGQLDAQGLKGTASNVAIPGIANTTQALTITDASSTVTDIDAMLSNLNVHRATAGAVINRLEHTVSNLMNVVQRTEEARSRIEDADFAAESAGMARANVLVQAGSAMLAQANQSPQFVLALLRS
jgi:flagellin